MMIIEQRFKQLGEKRHQCRGGLQNLYHGTCQARGPTIRLQMRPYAALAEDLLAQTCTSVQGVGVGCAPVGAPIRAQWIQMETQSTVAIVAEDVMLG